MEDAHIASPALTHKEETPVSLFGVFDGHGGMITWKFDEKIIEPFPSSCIF